MRTLVAFLLLAMALPAAATQPSDYASGMVLELADAQPFHRLELPLEVYRQARPDLADIRVFNAAGEAVPYAFAQGAAVSAPMAPVAVPRFPLRQEAAGNGSLDVRIETDGRLIALRRQESGASRPVTWLFDLSALREPVKALLLEWAPAGEGFSTAVQLDGSDDLRTWHPVAEAPLLDLRFGGQQLQQKRIAFPATRYRYLRLRGASALPPLTASAAEPLPAPAAAPERRLEVKGEPGPEPGDYEFDLGARLVATRIALHLPHANTVAPVEWQVRERRRDEWRPVLRTTAWRLQQGGADLDSPAIETGAVAGRYWRLRVDPRAGGLGAGAPVLRLSWRPAQVVFLTRGAPPFTLAFGQRDARPAQLPLASLIPGYETGMEATLPQAKAGAPRALGGRDAPAPGQEDQPPPDWKRWLLWGVLLGGVGLLALMARQLLQPRHPAP